MNSSGMKMGYLSSYPLRSICFLHLSKGSKGFMMDNGQGKKVSLEHVHILIWNKWQVKFKSWNYRLFLFFDDNNAICNLNLFCMINFSNRFSNFLTCAQLIPFVLKSSKLPSEFRYSASLAFGLGLLYLILGLLGLLFSLLAMAFETEVDFCYRE